MFSVFLGLGAAFSWGASDFIGGFLSRRTSALQTTLTIEVLGLPPLFLIVFLSHETGISVADWLWCLAAGAIGSLGFVALYQALAEGQMSIAAPLAALIAASLPVLTGILKDGLPSSITLLGFVLALFAIWLISPAETSESKKFGHLYLPILAGIGLGCYLIFINQGSQNGVWIPVLAARLGATTTLLIFAALQRDLVIPSASCVPLLLANAAFDIGGSVFYVLAGQYGRMDIAAVLASLYSGVTLALARFFLKERVNQRQWIGILITLAAIALMTL